MPRESGAARNHRESCGYWITRLRGRWRQRAQRQVGTEADL